MSGKLGYDIDIAHLNENDLKFSQQAVQVYNSIKNIIWHGDQYRLMDPWTNDVSAMMYSNADKTAAVLFSYLVGNRYGNESKSPIPLKGLDPDKKYQVREINLYPNTKSAIGANAIYSGSFLMKVGINPIVNSGRRSVVLEIRKVEN